MIFIIIIFFNSLLISGNNPYVIVLGIAQDGGSPHTGCENLCCKDLWSKNSGKKVSSLGIIDPKSKKSWIIDATPDFPKQYHTVTNEHNTELAGIFLTHAHMGHYTGLLYLGKEVQGAKKVPVFCMPKMKKFLEKNAPWSQLINLENIILKKLKNDIELKLSDQLFIEPFIVPHRDEFSETVGFKIMGVKNSVTFIPDIDKWNKWDQDIFKVIQHTGIALIDGTFYSQNEIPHRDMSEIPHPFIIETMDYLFSLKSIHKNKVYFIHLNHSNPAIKLNSAASNIIKSKQFNIAREGQIFNL
tara:strand:- start:21 stop:920 length:900 start_codon:yes stop_codon:yes gene_type:complete